MFGLSRNEQIRRKFRREGTVVPGEVLFVGRDQTTDLIEKALGVTPREGQTVVIRYRTREGEEQKTYLQMKDVSRCREGQWVYVRYIRWKEQYLAIVEEEIREGSL